MRTISVVVLTYNESHRLRPCLESVAGWADELIIVDGYSTDDTVALAREFTSLLYQSDLLGPDRPGGYSDQRNFALSKATGDWVFFLDADERVTPELREEIEARVLTGADEGHAVYLIRRLEHFFGVLSPYTHGQARQGRLLRRGFGNFDGRLVHESLVMDGTCGELSGYILHYSKDTVAQYVETMNRYTSLEAAELIQGETPLARTPWPAMRHAFLYRYIKMHGYREGTFGLLMCLMLTFYQYLIWAKHWEKCKDAGLIPAQTKAAGFGAALCSFVSGLWHGYGRFKNIATRKSA